MSDGLFSACLSHSLLYWCPTVSICWLLPSPWSEVRIQGVEEWQYCDLIMREKREKKEIDIIFTSLMFFSTLFPS